jgi:hypothetical protein
MINFVLLPFKNELNPIAWVQMLDVLPLQHQLISTGRIAINNDQNLIAFFEIALGNKTRVHFFILAYLERSLFASSVDRKVDIQKSTLTDWSQVEEEELFFEFVDLKEIESFAIIEIRILCVDDLSNLLAIDPTVLWGGLLSCDPREEPQYDKDDEVRFQIFFIW